MMYETKDNNKYNELNRAIKPMQTWQRTVAGGAEQRDRHTTGEVRSARRAQENEGSGRKKSETQQEC